MDKRKLIGTIIGVTMFAALIAGATFAWLSFRANVTNAAYNGKTRNFIFTYGGGTAVSNMIITHNPTTDVLGSIGKTTVSAAKSSTSSPSNSFKLNLTISSNTFTTKSVVYAVCKGTCPSSVKLATVSGSGTSTTASCASGVAACGTIYGTTTVTLYTDTSTFNTSAAASATYDIYFWLNSETLLNPDVGKKIVATISASATQNEAN